MVSPLVTNSACDHGQAVILDNILPSAAIVIWKQLPWEASKHLLTYTTLQPGKKEEQGPPPSLLKHTGWLKLLSVLLKWNKSFMLEKEVFTSRSEVTGKDNQMGIGDWMFKCQQVLLTTFDSSHFPAALCGP